MSITRLSSGAIFVLTLAARAGAAILVTPGANTVSTPRLELDFGHPNVERVDSVRWRNGDGVLGPNLVAAGGASPACTTADPLEAWGQAYGTTPPYLPVPVAAGSSGTWTPRGTRTVEIASSVPAACFGDDPPPVRTRYSFFDVGPGASMVRIERRFGFGADSADYTTEGLRPYVVRMSSTPQMLFPNAGGTALIATGTSGEGTITDDWNGTWLALNGPNQSGVVILRDPGNASAAKLILDDDLASGSYLSSVDLTRPPSGWKAPLTEIEHLCFYDTISWPLAVRGPGSLPDGCAILAVPINVAAPSITGEARVDGQLDASVGTWDFATDAFAFQWHRCDGDACESIPGATMAQYMPAAADADRSLRVDVTAVSADGETDVASATSDVVGADPCAGASTCRLDDGPLFRATTGAMAVTGADADGAPLPLADLGAVAKRATLGAVRVEAKKFFVGASGVPGVAGGDWTPLLPGPDIALVGSSRKKKLALQFAAPVFAAGFEVVEPETGPNVGPVFGDATFTLRLKHGRKTVAETLFNAPNDVAAYVGLWSEQPFDRMEIRSGGAAGTKVFGKIDVGYLPGFSRRRNILVVDGRGGIDQRGALIEVQVGSGFRTELQDFGNRAQGPLGLAMVGVIATAPDVAFVLADAAGIDLKPALFRVDLRTGIRTTVSDMGDPALGPVGFRAGGVAMEASGSLLVIDYAAGKDEVGTLFRIDARAGVRTVLSDFGTGQRRGDTPKALAVERSGDVVVLDRAVDSDETAAGAGAIFRVNGKSGSRTILSDFSDATQGPIGEFVVALAIEASGQLLVVDRDTDRLLRIDSKTGMRTLLSDFRTSVQGIGGHPELVTVEPSGQVLVVVRRSDDSTHLVRVQPLTGRRTLFTSLAQPGLGTPVVDPSALTIRR